MRNPQHLRPNRCILWMTSP
ncbi:hypothetical protein Goarm_003614, partial [Gossypium armourianum]|nr:hypothetical protein [Gossypium armourianum]